MRTYDRRTFLEKVGSGLLVSTAGLALTDRLDLLGFLHAAGPDRLDFGELEPLAALIQQTDADALMPALKAELDRGTDLRAMITAAALANARTFGGQDYTGYHCFMAMVPALEMSGRLSGERAALPVLKVLHRNARRTQQVGGREDEVLRPVELVRPPHGDPGSLLLAAGRNGEFDAAEAVFARVAEEGSKEAFGSLQPLVRDNIDVHQVVIAYRSWDMTRLAGEENGEALLRQVLRHCIDRDEGRRRRGQPAPAIRTLLPELIEAHGLSRKIAETKRLSTRALDDLAQLIFVSGRGDAARAVAGQLAAGVSRDDVGEALSLASVRLLLHDPGRSRGQEGKPVGSVHGASVGLHASDSANAWRGIAAAMEPAEANATLVTAAWHAAGQSGRMDTSRPHHAAARETVRDVPAGAILPAIAEAVRGNDQGRACALAERHGQMGGDPDALLDRLIVPAIRDDGALHHEKYYLTATEEFARGRPEFRWAHLVALTRVMASGNGFEAPGLALAEQVLGA